MKNDEFEFVGYEEPEQPQEESYLGSAARNLLRSSSRVGETLFGLPGDVAQTIGKLEKFADPNRALIEAGQFGINKLLGRKTQESQGLLPTSEGIREITKGIGDAIQPGFLEPQSETAKFSDEFFQDLTSIVHPLGGPISKGSAIKGLVSSGLGNIAKVASKTFGVGEFGQGVAKLGTMLLSSLGFGPSLKKQASELYEKSAELIPEGVNVNAEPLRDFIKKSGKPLARGAKTASKDYINLRLEELQNAINSVNNTIPVEDSYQFIKDINEHFSDRSIPKKAEAFGGELIDIMKKSINSLKDSHPEFVETFNEASDLYKTVNTSSRINSFIQNVGDKIINKSFSPVTAYIFGTKPYQLAGAAGAAGIKKISNELDKIFRSPTARNIYQKAIIEGAKQNVGPLTRYIKQFDKIAKKELDQSEESDEGEFEFVGYS